MTPEQLLAEIRGYLELGETERAVIEAAKVIRTWIPRTGARGYSHRATIFCNAVDDLLATEQEEP